MFKFNITGDCLRLESFRPLKSGSKGYYTAEFTFDSDWDGLIPHITIIENGTPRADEIIADGAHTITTTENGIMQIGVYGLDSEGKKCISTNLVCIEVSPGAYTGVTPLPKDIWDGYQVVVLGYVKRAECAADKAESMQMHGPVIGENGNWWIWLSDTEEYVDTGESSKGDKGDTGKAGKDGANGKDGAAGKDGYTPVRGTDYWTDEDKAEIKGYVDEAILGGAW